MNYKKKLLKAIQLSFKNYIKFGARSSKKLYPLHHEIVNISKNIFGKSYEYHSYDNKELKVKGKYYDKNIDITITKNNIPICGIGVKFVTSNYKQNANNYFENMMGETANIQANQIPYFHFIVLRHQTPYYKKTSQKTGKKTADKIETINKKDLMKYINLILDNPQAHRPRAIGIFLIAIDENSNKVTSINLKNYFDSDFIELFENNLSIEKLFDEIKNYKNFIELKNG